MNEREKTVTASLAILAILQLLMLAALYTQTKPHPPLEIPFFSMAPFLASSVAVAIAAAIMGPLSSFSGKMVSLAAAFLALVSFGPQKWFDPAFPSIWPAVLLAQCAVTAILFTLWVERQKGNRKKA